MCLDFVCTFVLPSISLLFTLFNLVTDWMSFFQYVSAPPSLLEFSLITAVVYCVLGCLSGTINLILEVRLFRERILERKELRYGGGHNSIKGGMSVSGYRRQRTLDRPDKYLTFVLPFLLSTVLLQDVPSVIINSFFINYCTSASPRACDALPSFPCSIEGYIIPPQGMPLVQYLTLNSSLISLLGCSARLFFAPVWICSGACGCRSQCCADDEDDDDYDEDRHRCCCTHNIVAKIFFVVFSFVVFVVGVVFAVIVVAVNFVDSSVVGGHWHVPPHRSNHTLMFSGSHTFLDGDVESTIKFSAEADFLRLATHGEGGLFVTYKASCKDILYNGLPQKISHSERRDTHAWMHDADTTCVAHVVKKQKRRQPDKLKDKTCSDRETDRPTDVDAKIWNEKGNCNLMFRLLYDRKRFPPVTYSAVPIDDRGQARRDGGRLQYCAVNQFWRQQTLEASFIGSCRRRLLDCDWLVRNARFLPASVVDFVKGYLAFCPRPIGYEQRPESCQLVDKSSRAGLKSHVTVQIDHPNYKDKHKMNK